MISIAQSASHRPQTHWVQATLLVLGLVVVPVAVAAEDVAPTQLVSDTAAVCLEVPHFEATWYKLQNSRLMERLREFPPVQRFLAGAGFQKWNQIQAHVRQSTGKSLSDHLLGSFGESIVVAVYLPDGRPPEGVLIGRARDAVALTQALQMWAQLDPQHESKSKVHLGQSYIRRARSANSSDVVYYTVFDRTIAISDQEGQIQRVIELHAATSRKVARSSLKPLEELPLFRSNREQQPRDAAAFVFLNTRAWDKVVDGELQKSAEGKWLQSAFHQVAAVTVSLRLDEEVVVDIAADLRGAAMAPVWKRFVEGASSRRGGWQQRIPQEAILAISSRMETGPLVQAWLALNPDVRTEEFSRGRNFLKSLLLGRDLFTDVLPNTLRDWSVSVVPADAAVSESSPVDLVGQVSLNGAQTGTEIPLDRSLDNALQFGMNLLSAMLSHQRATGGGLVVVKSTISETGVERTLDGLKVWSPGYRVSPQQLQVATSASALARVQSSAAAAVRDSRLAACERRYFHSTSQLIWLDAVRLRSILSTHSNWIAGQLEPASQDGRDRVLQHLSKLTEAATVVDAAFVAAKFDDDSAHFVFGAALDRSE